MNSLKRQYNAIDKLAKNGMIFWDYGNAFLLECRRAFDNDNVIKNDIKLDIKFEYPSYM
jgi:urocanate hydratase